MISDEGQRFIDAIREYSIALAPGGALAGWWMGRRKSNAEAEKLLEEGDALRLDSITRHFQALIDGYEARVKDLTDEVEALRAEVQALRRALDKRPRGGQDVA